MIRLGRINDLKIARLTDFGLFLEDNHGSEVLLPNKYCPEEYDFGDEISVYIFKDSEDRLTATTITPAIGFNEFAFLQVSDVSRVGAFLDWGLEKELLVPFKEQRQKMEIDRWYVVYLDVDIVTNRLFASNKIEKRLDNSVVDLNEGDEVQVLVYKRTELGFSVIVNQKYKGLIFENEVFQDVNIGDNLKAFVKKIREENKIDISLQPIGYEKFNDANVQLIYDRLVKENGSLSINDKSTPDEIYGTFGISKKAFKKAVGSLYKDRKITISEDGIKLNSTSEG